ncbi:MAG: hypothetical protein A2X22_10105 [Bacteroidetes bacterium GWF2_49_14]|nr:MAG: hypothetical protein A2X22_10105 [Bacteroidetes bacterium GWF2_49_14]HBB92059.1 hypothetical protein [Bacteroidales bacterium]
MSDWLIQGIGFIGLLFFVISFQQNNRNRILLIMLAGQICFLGHYALLGAWTGFAMNIVGAGRTLVFRFKEEKKWAAHWIWPVIFIALLWVSGIVTWDSPLSLFPPFAMTIETIGLWMKRPKRIRFINLFPHPFWFTYNLLMGSWAGVATEIIVFGSIVVAIFRYDLKKKSKPVGTP